MSKFCKQSRFHSKKKKKILFLSRSLNYGGAERQLVELAKLLYDRGWNVGVAVFYDNGPLEHDLRKAGVPVIELHKRGRWDVFGFMWRLAMVLKTEEPDILHSYLVMPNLVAVILKPLFSRFSIVWGVRASNKDFRQYDWFWWLTFWLSCRLSSYADLIIVNSYAGRKYHVQFGYPEDRMVVIPNGIDTRRFRPDAKYRRRMRAKWDIKDNDFLIGLIARLDPMKDHPTFLRAMSLLSKKRHDIRFVCIGDGPEDYKARLHALSCELGLDNHLIWASSRHDMPAIYNALDIAVSSSSYGEGFSNVISEAMACGVPNVTTNVGDSPYVVGKTGIVVPPKSPMKLAQGIEQMILKLKSDKNIHHLVRKRIEENFIVEILCDRTIKALNCC